MFSEIYNCNYLFSKIISLELFVTISVLITIIFSYIYLKYYRGNIFGDIGFFLIILGGAFNLSSWLLKGCVKDFINFFGLFYFNIYDLMVTTGVILVSIIIWKKK